MTNSFTEKKVEEFEKEFSITDCDGGALHGETQKATSFLRSALRNHTAYLRKPIMKILDELQWQNSLLKEGMVIKNAKNGGYILNDHQRRMDDLFDKKRSDILALLDKEIKE